MHFSKSVLLAIGASTAVNAREHAFTYPATFYEFDNGLNLRENRNDTDELASRSTDVALQERQTRVNVKYFAGPLILGGYLEYKVAPAVWSIDQYCYSKDATTLSCVGASIQALGVFVFGAVGFTAGALYVAGLLDGDLQILNNVGNNPGKRSIDDASLAASRIVRRCPNNSRNEDMWDGYYKGDYGVKIFCTNTPSPCKRPDSANIKDLYSLMGQYGEEVDKQRALDGQFTVYEASTKIVLWRCGMEIDNDSSGFGSACPDEITGGDGCTYTGQ